MNRAANAYKKHGPPIGPDDDVPDTHAAGQQTVRIVPAGSTPPPVTTGAASVFAAGQAAKPKRAHTPGPALQPHAVVIKSGVPIAPHIRGGSPGFNRALVLLQRMKRDDMVEVSHRHANSLAAQAKTAGIKIAKRKLSAETSGVWRLS